MKVEPIRRRKPKPRNQDAKRIPFLFVAVPVNFIREWVSQLSPTATVIYSLICYRTWYFNKARDAISMSQFQHDSGCGRTVIWAAIKELESLHLIIVRREHRKTSVYEISPARYVHIVNTN